MVDKIVLVCIFFILNFSGCASTHPVETSNDLPPAWVTNPPKDTSSTMWGVGGGADLDAAKRSALKDVAAKLRVAVSAKLESRITVSSHSVDIFASTRIAEEVQRTEFKNYTFEKSESAGQEFYALVSLDRRAFILDAERKLAAAETEMAIQIAKGKNGGVVEQFVAQQKALPWIEKAIASAQLLSAADPDFDINRLSRHEAALAHAKSSANELTFHLKAKNDSSDVTQELRNYLNSLGVRTGKGGVPLVVDTGATQDTVFGSNTVTLRINLSVIDANGRSLSSKEYSMHGHSMTDHRMARQAAVKEFGEKLQEGGALASLGFISY